MNQDLFAYTSPDEPISTPKGSLAGIRLAIQPNLSVRGWPTRAGSRALENFVAIEDAAVVERIRVAGAYIAGYTHMAELGLGLDGDTSATVVASSHSDAAIVIDTLGEARVAAAEAQLIGFKPTASTISRRGLVGLAPSLECLGVVAGEAVTISRILQETAGPDPGDFSLGDAFPDFGCTLEVSCNAAVIPQSLECLSPDEVRAFKAALSVMEERGFEVRETPLEDFGPFRAVHQAIGAVEASSSAGKFDGVRYGHRASKADDWNEMYLRSREESFGPQVKAFLFQGAYFQFQDYAAFENACRLRRRLVGALDAILAGSDMIILPTRSKAAATGKGDSLKRVYDRFALTLAANVAGLPAVSLPGLVKLDGDDLGLQLVGRRLDDDRLLRCAAGLTS